MKSNGFSRRGLLMGAATLAVSRLKAADDTTLPTMELQQMAEGVSGLGRTAICLRRLLYGRKQRARYQCFSL